MQGMVEQAPEAVRLVRDFINTMERQTDQDTLRNPEDLSAWLQDHGLHPVGATLGASDLRLAKAIREGLRTVLDVHGGGIADDAAIHALNRALAEVPIVLAFTGPAAQLSLIPAKPTRGSAALAPLVAAVNGARVDGTWERLKVCARDSCRWAFYDASRNRSGRWCSMAGCGNYVKMRRAYAVRTGRPLPESPTS